MTTTNGHTRNSSPQGPLGEREKAFLMQEMVGNVLLSRSDLFRQLMDPRRDIDTECGYPASETGSGAGSINPELFRTLYERECIATRVVQVLPKECWQVQPLVYEDEDAEVVTPFEEAWDALSEQLRGETSWYQDEHGSPVWEHLRRADILSGIGHFGVLLIGVDDGLNLDQPVEGVSTTDPKGGSAKQGDTKQGGASHGDPAGLFGPSRNRRNYPSKPTKELGWGPAYSQDPKTGHPVLTGNRRYEEGSGDEPVGGHPARPVHNKIVSSAEDLLSGAVGTDAQYVGVQLSPPEFPSSQPSTERRKLLFLRTYDESLVQIVQYEADVRNPRFGQPVMYRITLNDPREQHSGIGLPMATVRVHWSRIIHLADNCGSSEIFGVPRLRPVLNRVLDLRKLYSGSAEMYWRGAFPGISLETVPQLGGDVQVDVKGTQDFMEQYMNGLQRYLILMGMSAKTLSPTVVDPSQQIDVQITAICIELGMPKRVFMGSERGELASTQDDDAWLDRLRERQQSYVTPRIIVPFIDRLIQMGVLPEPGGSKGGKGDGVTGNVDDGGGDDTAADDQEHTGGYSVEWPELTSLNVKDKAAVLLQKTQAYAAYVSGGLEAVIPPKDYLTRFDDMDEEEADAVLDAASKAHEDEDVMTMPPQVAGRDTAAPPGSQDHADAEAQADQAKQMADAKAQQPGAKPGNPFGGGKPLVGPKPSSAPKPLTP